jgi:purine-binding chemotaxis protein CheW
MSDISTSILETEQEFEDTQKDKFLTFTLGKEYYGIEINYITEIINIQSITEVPELTSYVKGIINLRSKIIPVIDVRLRFKKPAVEYDERTCIIIIEIQGLSIGLIVDTVSEVISISDDCIVKLSDSQTGFQSGYIKGIGQVENEIKLILDCDKLLADSDIEN